MSLWGKQLVVNSIMLADLNKQYLAEFLVMVDPDNPDPDKQWVKCIPFFAMHEMYRTDISNPISCQAGMTMPDVSFLGYITTIVNYTRKDPYKMEMFSRGTSKYTNVILKEGMLATDIADLTCFPLEKVKLYYRNFFIVKDD